MAHSPENRSRLVRILAASAAGVVAWFSALPALAVETGLQATAGAAGLDTSSSIQGITTSLINQVLGLVGVAFLVLMVVAGVMWMTAGGNDQRIGTAKKIMTGAVIGIIIIFASFYITNFVLTALTAGNTPSTP